MVDYFPIDVGTIPLYRGDAAGRNNITITLLDDAGNPVSLLTFGTAWTCTAKSAGTTIALDVDITQAAAGVIVASIPDADSPDLPAQMAFDLEATGGTVSPLTVFSGRFTASGQVTTP